MDMILYCILGIVCFLAGRTSTPKEIVKQLEMTGKQREEYEYQLALNRSLLAEVQQYRTLENQLRGELWETKQTLKKLQQKN